MVKLISGVPVWEFDIAPLKNQLLAVCQNQVNAFERIREKHDKILRGLVSEITETFPSQKTGWPPGVNPAEEVKKRYAVIEGRIGYQTDKLKSELLAEIVKFKAEIEKLTKFVQKI
jgi:hypothetical protein